MENMKQFKNGNYMVLEDGKWTYYTKAQFERYYHICAHCGNAVENTDAIESAHSNDFFCSEECAIAAGLTQCDECGEWIDPDRLDVVEADGHYFCDEDCARNYGYYQCERCGAWVYQDDALWVDNDERCFCDEDCAENAGYFQCYSCDEWFNFRHEGTRSSDGSHYFCGSCTDDLYYCEDCGEYFEDEDSLVWDEEDECYYCESCSDSHRCSRAICDYHTSKRHDDYNFLRTSANESRMNVPFAGLELEVDCGDDPYDTARNIANEIPGVFFFEHDGSLSSRGFEIISQPASVLWHVENRDMYKRLRKILIANDYRSNDTDTCGLHIHIDKQYFGQLLDTATAKLLFLMERHWDNLVLFSRRSESRLKRWAARYDLGRTHEVWNEARRRYELVSDTVVSIAKRRCAQDSRYHALNLTNDHTIEFRLWKGTLNIQTLMATIKFTARLCELAKTVPSVKLASMTFEDLLGDDPDIKAYWAIRTNAAQTGIDTADDGENL